MSHVRTQIRNAVAAEVTGLTTSGARVYETRIYPYDADDHLPGLAVYTVTEARLDDGDVVSNWTEGYRALRLVVEARAKAASGVDDTLDTMCAEVEAALYDGANDSGTTLYGLIKGLDYVETELEYSGESDQPVALARVTFSIMYRVDGLDPETAIS